MIPFVVPEGWSSDDRWCPGKGGDQWLKEMTMARAADWVTDDWRGAAPPSPSTPSLLHHSSILALFPPFHQSHVFLLSPSFPLLFMAAAGISVVFSREGRCHFSVSTIKF